MARARLGNGGLYLIYRSHSISAPSSMGDGKNGLALTTPRIVTAKHCFLNINPAQFPKACRRDSLSIVGASRAMDPGIALRVSDMVYDALCDVKGPAASDETVLKAQAGLFALKELLTVMAGEYAKP